MKVDNDKNGDRKYCLHSYYFFHLKMRIFTKLYTTIRK
jgi:hypothetical protein